MTGAYTTRRNPIGARRRGRVIAMQIMFEIDVTEHPVNEVLNRQLELLLEDDPLREWVTGLVEGTLAKQERIDELLQETASLWPLRQMAPVERSILRLAVFELLFNNDQAPAKAVINEAVEVAKLFGADRSFRFVNGVLGSILDRKTGKAAGQCCVSEDCEYTLKSDHTTSSERAENGGSPLSVQGEASPTIKEYK